MTLRVVITDDEELARHGIRSRLARSRDVEIVAECRNGRETIEAVRRTSPDLVFLDVQMPGKNGFEVIETIGWDSFPHVIFVTAHDRYAIHAFDVNAVDYLLKPIDDERFDLALARARESLSRERDSDFRRRLASVVNEMAAESRHGQSKARSDRIVIRSGGRLVFVRVAEIDWIEAAGDYVSLHAGKKSWLLRQTIAAMEKELEPSGFARIHRSTLVQLDRISELKSLDNGEYLVLLRDATSLKLSRNYRQALERMLSGPP
jgi:two-component system LytT family response regulator